MVPRPAHSTRRGFLHTIGAALGGAILIPDHVHAGPRTVRKPPRLREGDTVGLVNPAGATYVREDLDIVKDTLRALGLSWKLGTHVTDRYGYLAGTDADRAADLNAMFADPEVDAIMAVRGGWGCNRLLQLLDYESIALHPKILIGYSDITSLLIACLARTGLVTFHGPVGTSTWNQFSVGYFKRVLMEGSMECFRNPRVTGDSLAQTRDRVHTITPGKARGVLIGGNLTVLTAMLGSPYLPPWDKVILFLEDDNEQIYRIDRMLTQLRLAGVFRRVRGVAAGQFADCGPKDPSRPSLTLEQVLAECADEAGVPFLAGLQFGHVTGKLTLPVGVRCRLDGSRGRLRLLEGAVV